MNDYILPKILKCGYFNCFEEFGNLMQSPERISKGIEIELFLEDGYSTFLNGYELKILKDHIIVAKAGSKRHSILPFKTIFLKISAEGELEKVLNNLPDYFQSIHTDKIKDTLKDIILLNEEKEKNHILIGIKILTLIDILIIDSALGNSANNKSYHIMHQAKKVIEKRYSEKITTQDIAAEINLSESRFRFLFGKVYGISPRQYLTDVRISHAKQMIWENYSMSYIAEKCGFGCQQYFNEIFKKETGTSPGKYKKELMERYHD